MDYKYLLKLTVNLFLLILLFFGAGFCFFKSVQAQEENTGLRILYQGNLLDSEDVPVQDGNYNMRFSIYDSETEGSIIWQEEYVFYNAVFVKNGQFKIILGRIKPLNLKIGAGPFWLGVSIGQQTDTGEIVWSLGMEQRKKIMSLSDFLKQEGLGYFEENGITEQEWEEIYRLLEEKLSGQPNLILLFDLEQIKTNENGSDSKLFDILKTFINFISEKISEIGDKITELGKKIDEVLAKMEEITLALLNIGEKIDRIYQVLITNKGLELGQPLPLTSEINNYTSQKFDQLIIKEGESSIRIFNQSIKIESLIFISFLNDPGSQWWISEKVPGGSFTLSLKEPATQDLIFNYWILDEEEQSVQSPIIEIPEEIGAKTKEKVGPTTEPITTSSQIIKQEVDQEEILPISLESEPEQEQEQEQEQEEKVLEPLPGEEEIFGPLPEE